MPPKRKRSSIAAVESETPLPPPLSSTLPPRRKASSRAKIKAATNPDRNPQVLDGPNATRASPDSDVNNDLPLNIPAEPAKKKRATAAKKKTDVLKAEAAPKASDVKDEFGAPGLGDPEAEGEEVAGEEELSEALSRPPPVNSDYLPLPWKGRLGYACLNTYLRYSNPPVFSSRTCRIASIIEHRHPLKDPSQPEHSTNNRPDKEQSADMARGQKWVEALGLANARDIIKMLRWNDRYGIKFMRLSSEMFPFASHEEYGYSLAPFATDTLAEVGKVVAELGHRVTTHPGQFTQLGSPRKSVVDNAMRDLVYHDELLSLLKLPPQQDRDAVMILHMGGMFGSKPETLDRFRENYAKLSPSIKNRLVLENDDMTWHVHDLLPVCQELNIPMVLDFHHHNIIFDAEKIREGTKDIMELYPSIRETWTRKGITQKMHYSEQTPPAITRTQRRKHNHRPATLPPCADDMDLMIEAKDKEQAVFELMRTFKLPGFDRISDMIPHVRRDDNKPIVRAKPKTPKKKKTKVKDEGADEITEEATQEVEVKEQEIIADDEVGMGGPEGRVYWPPGMEEWLRPKKREVKPKDENKKPPKKQPQAEDVAIDEAAPKVQVEKVAKKPPAKKAKAAKRKTPAAAPTPSVSDEASSELSDLDEDEASEPVVSRKAAPARASKRGGKVSYTEPEHSEGE
ncbi:UV-endonuclease UvdE [Venturia nashicola]|uniref:UV-endonuclease UvdE n=1 Tax=Venturia nashicola TaxID=86259 RepID=A0A4Z1PP85_9PEZI|nr:UV-endonuclease UvdE [Venturia nashicola]